MAAINSKGNMSNAVNGHARGSSRNGQYIKQLYVQMMTRDTQNVQKYIIHLILISYHINIKGLNNVLCRSIYLSELRPLSVRIHSLNLRPHSRLKRVFQNKTIPPTLIDFG